MTPVPPAAASARSGTVKAPSPYKTADEMAVIARCSRQTLWRYRTAGIIRAGVYQPGRGHLLFEPVITMLEIQAYRERRDTTW